MDMRVVGVYPVTAPEPTHLVELAVMQCSRRLDLALFTQEQDDTPRENWQVPWGEQFLDRTGEALLNPREPDAAPSVAEFRVAFFFHYLELDKPLITPVGHLALPQPEGRPARLEFITYEPPS